MSSRWNCVVRSQHLGRNPACEGLWRNHCRATSLGSNFGNGLRCSKRTSGSKQLRHLCDADTDNGFKRRECTQCGGHPPPRSLSHAGRGRSHRRRIEHRCGRRILFIKNSSYFANSGSRCTARRPSRSKHVLFTTMGGPLATCRWPSTQRGDGNQHGTRWLATFRSAPDHWQRTASRNRKHVDHAHLAGWCQSPCPALGGRRSHSDCNPAARGELRHPICLWKWRCDLEFRLLQCP